MDPWGVGDLKLEVFQDRLTFDLLTVSLVTFLIKTLKGTLKMCFKLSDKILFRYIRARIYTFLLLAQKRSYFYQTKLIYW